jgi:putative Flp pilus-assembly TadE/G-like protein
MTGRLEQLHEEKGQTLVLFVVLLTGLVVLLAFVVDVGGWLGTQRRLQSVADAAALAAIQTGQVPVSPAIDDGWAILQYGQSGLPDSVTVTARHDAPIIFGGVAGIPKFTEQVTATAKAAAASTLSNSTLIQVAGAPGGTAPYVTPIVVNACIFSATPCPGAGNGFSSSDCFLSSPGCDLNFDASDSGGSLFGIANISFVAARANTFSNWMLCAKVSSCAPGSISGNSTCPQACPAQLTRGVSSNRAVQAMNSTIGKTLIFPVFDSFDQSTNEYHIVGFSAFVVTTTQFDNTKGTGNWQANDKVIHGSFSKYTLAASFGTSGGAGQDFGVRAIGLTT